MLNGFIFLSIRVVKLRISVLVVVPQKYETRQVQYSNMSGENAF